MNNVFLSLGSNIGNRLELLNLAREAIEAQIGRIQLRSSVYETEPWGFNSSDYFFNQVICLNSYLQSQEILDEINLIEKNLGRIRGKEQYATRTMDIDILFFNNLIFHSADLQIPHPEIQNRRFILEPLAEIAGEFIHPVFNVPVSELLGNCPDTCKVVKLGKT